MKIPVTCPECAKAAMLSLTEKEEEEIKERILAGGRSPALIATCPNGHELLVTVYFRGGEFGVRDVVVPLRADDEKGEISEVDWVGKAFGGGK
jgi:hypothetical protein